MSSVAFSRGLTQLVVRPAPQRHQKQNAQNNNQNHLTHRNAFHHHSLFEIQIWAIVIGRAPFYLSACVFIIQAVQTYPWLIIYYSSRQCCCQARWQFPALIAGIFPICSTHNKPCAAISSPAYSKMFIRSEKNLPKNIGKFPILPRKKTFLVKSLS